ncbi:hypothetical protein GOBAR_AA34557 [Gossypium barbadense]|uniref:EXS domain-containing protein n=1 Tax=Gossypium barbadense TaxID=3634 RepID=A0A2P5W4V6_GOSBA|nr:hypothetical protein GOBAR_AA34557 [Gossypium barbadense]
MFGGQVAAPINSPHLRRSGSRAVVSDLGAELGNGVENSYVHPLELNGSKNASIPLVTAAIVPSPTLLWRFKVYFWVIGSNLILRCTWTYKLSAHLRNNYLTVFTIAALEIFRRFQWIFFRVENEWNKINSRPNMQVSMNDPSDDEVKLLSSSAGGYNV